MRGRSCGSEILRKGRHPSGPALLEGLGITCGGLSMDNSLKWEGVRHQCGQCHQEWMGSGPRSQADPRATSLSPFVALGILQPQSPPLLMDTATPARRTGIGNNETMKQ